MKREGQLFLKVCACALVLMSSVVSACGQKPQQQTATKGAPAPSPESPALKHYEIKPSDLPPPNASPDAENGPRVTPRPAGAELQLPPGFKASVYAEGGDFRRPRWMALAPNGDVFVADHTANSIFILRDTDNDGVAETRFTFAANLNLPFGMAFWEDYFYVANTNAVVRFHYKVGQTRAEGEPEKIADLPGRGYREHWTRNIIFNPEGTKLYATVGSESNVSVEPEPRAAILEFNPDGTGRRLLATGTRNPIGLAFRPGTSELWAAVQERDRLGDDLVPDFVTRIQDGGFYGWPYSYADQREDPRRKGERPDLVRKTIVPDVLIQAHSAVLGLVFYEGGMFPAEYRGDAFVALHGSWNRSKRTGYKIICIRFKDGRAAGGYDDFLTGWMLGEDREEVWGRPVGLLVLKDGSLLITDDGANKIWRVTYDSAGGAKK
ncbi:MAG TPA: sorbosone dehydrogenase family protein [Pyrinomonadaceae bacterium]|nr:sorbosone dehydrogenase family protein [Pyrinomonadaceae bacterium]